MQETFSMLVEILQDKFDVPKSMLRETTIEEIGLDSLDMINLLFVVEEKLGIKFPEKGFEEETIETLGDLVHYINDQIK